MSPEEVPAELVERVADLIDPLEAWSAGLRTLRARQALSAVLPEIQAQALRDAAGMFRSQTMPRGRLLDEAARLRKEATS